MSRRIPAKFHGVLRQIADYRAECRSRGKRPRQCTTTTTALSAARRFIEDTDARLMFLSGDFGSGKSFAAACAAYEVDRRIRCDERPLFNAKRRVQHDYNPPRTSEWITVPQLCQAPRWTQGEVLGFPDLLAALRRPAFLVLDELGQEAEAPDAAARLQEIINVRHEQPSKRTVVLTNLSDAMVHARYGGRIRSRLRESGVEEDGTTRWWIDCLEADMRGRVTPKIPEFTPREPEPEFFADWMEDVNA